MATQKKTADVDYSMQEKIIALYELQKIDSKIDEINKVKGELPLEVQDLEDEMTGLKTRIDNINAEIEELNTLTKQRKREVDQAKILIGNYKEQQNNVRNNREFDAITKEIEYQELEIELAEKRLKEYAAGVKAKKLQLEEAEAVADGRAADLAAKKSELEGIEAETAPQVAEYEVQADRAKAKIDERLLSAYGRIRRNVRNGLAVVTVKRDACGGCFNRIPPQRQVEIRQGKKLIVCEYCGRIMIDPELAGVQIEHKVEEAPATTTKRDRGVTGIQAKGMYTKQEKCMLLCVVSRKQIVWLKETVMEIDPKAFLIICDAREVWGEGFQSYSEKI